MLEPDEFLEKLKKNSNFSVIESLDDESYSLIVIYKGNCLCGCGAGRSFPTCPKYKKKRAQYINNLKEDINKLGISIE